MKQIEKLYSSMIGKHQLWELWQDSMSMFAASISNAVDKRYYEKREADYIFTAKKYTKEEMTKMVQIMSEIVIQLEENQEQDLLGALYMQLNLGSHWHGQFFTPYNICQAMAQMHFGRGYFFDINNPHPIPCCDPACGGGALLIAAANEFRKALSPMGLNAQDYICLYAQDLSKVSAMMCYIQLSLLGFAAKIKIGDSLADPLLESDDGENIWYTPAYFSGVWTMRRVLKAMKGGIKA